MGISCHRTACANACANTRCAIPPGASTCDRLLARLGERHPGYGFERNAGYGTPEHRAAIVKLGPTCEHRTSFKARCFAEWRAASGGS